MRLITTIFAPFFSPDRQCSTEAGDEARGRLRRGLEPGSRTPQSFHQLGLARAGKFSKTKEPHS
jgi:hypothetical protein